MKNFRPMILFVALLLVVSMACSVGGGSTPQPQQNNQQPPAPPPTEPPTVAVEQPTTPPEPTVVPPTPTQEVSKYFTEEFDTDPGWKYFLTSGDEDKITTKFENSRMIFDLEATDIYAYYLYEGASYDDVSIQVRAENRGKNNNNVSLVCRYSDKGWYEFSTEGGGLWYLWGVTINEKNEAVYNRIDNGGALALKQGKETNEYGMTCKGNEITLTINGTQLKKVKETNYAFRDGYVGINISSLNVYPIILEVDWFKIGQP